MSCIDSSTTTNGGFRVNVNLRKRLQQRKRRLLNRIDKSHIPSTPAIDTPTLELQLADRTQAISAGGLCPILQMIKTLDLRHHINSCIPIFKVYAPYDEADHVLNIALNLLAGGTCLDHLEIRRTDEAYLNALGAQRIPDPTTAGDFCRRFDEMKILMLMQAINKSRLQVWTQQPAEFFERAIIEADGTIVETSGQRKEGIGMNYKKQWETIRWLLRWPTPKRSCTSTIEAVVAQATRTLASFSTDRSSCAAVQDSKRFFYAVIQTLR